MRTRLVAVAAVLAASIPPGTTAYAHGGGHDRGSPPPHRGGPPPQEEPHRPGDAQSGRRNGRFSMTLSGSQVQEGGDPKGRGEASLLLDSEEEVVCLRSTWRELSGAVTAMHIHHGPEGQSGPHHIEILNDERLSGSSNRVEFCVQVNGGEPIQQIIDRPADFYLNVHTTDYPDGAIRGQFR
jgi:hypothetical protein